MAKRYLATLIVMLTVGVSLSLALSNAPIQQPAAVATGERERGIQLYQNGDTKGAIDALRIAVKRKSDDLSAWHYLGLALEQKGDRGSARKAHEKAARLGDDLLERQLTQSPSSKELPRSLLVIKSQLIEAVESAEKYVALGSKLSSSKRAEWDIRINSLRGFAELAGDYDLEIVSGKEVTTKARVLSKPQPTYTSKARGNQVTGTVTLRCIFGANGKVFGIRAVSVLPDGLTESAIQAARKIRFIPATKDGHPVSMWMELQYNFNLF
jgi:TonB family protein